MNPTENHPDDRYSAVKLFDAAEVANLLGIHVRTVWRLTATGELPPPVRLGKAGRIVRWRLTDLVAFLEREGSNR